MKKAILYIILFYLTLLYAQEWTIPIHISNMTCINNGFDYCIDSQGTIHVVFAKEYEPARVVKVEYTKSTDGGINWTTPVIISEEDSTELLMGKPWIVADSQNNLHVTYYYHAYENNKLHYRKCTNGVWGPFIDVTPGYEAVYNYDLVIDNNDRVYTFFTLPYYDDVAHYCMLEDGVWSNVMTPFYSELDMFSIMKAVPDGHSNLYCIGSFTNGGQVPKMAYYFYNALTQTWDNPVPLGEYRLWNGKTLALDNNGNPHLAWEEYLGNSIRACYAFSEYGDWSNISIIDNYSSPVSMLYHGNTQYLISFKRFPNSGLYRYNLMFYTDEDWENGEQITNSANAAGTSRMILWNDTIYLIYVDLHTNSIGDFYLITKNLSTGIEDNTIPHPDNLAFNFYPNPFNSSATISFTLAKSEITDLAIYNLKGQRVKTLTKGNQIPGKHTYTWDGTDSAGKQVPSCIYFTRLSTSVKTLTAKLVRLS